MPEFEAMYHKMFNAVTDVDRKLSEVSIQLRQICMMLRAEQQECEEIYISADEQEN